MHPWEEIQIEIKKRWRTQKQFAILSWKKVSEVNELIKGKRNITIQRDLILSDVLWTSEKYWIQKQIDFDYSIAKEKYQKLEKKEETTVVWASSAQNIIKKSKKTQENVFKRF